MYAFKKLNFFAYPHFLVGHFPFCTTSKRHVTGRKTCAASETVKGDKSEEEIHERLKRANYRLNHKNLKVKKDTVGNTLGGSEMSGEISRECERGCKQP